MRTVEDRLFLQNLLSSVTIPEFVQVAYEPSQIELSDASQAVKDALRDCPAMKKLCPGQQVAITAGSREIRHMAEILRTLGQEIRITGAVPFVVPAMGSHGGATAQGQIEVLEHYGITEQSVRMEIRSSMETVLIGRTENGCGVYLDKYAARADYIIPVGRIKAHTDFHGEVESGLVKMLVIGLGKQQGASICHKLGFPNMGTNLLRFGKVILETMPVLFGLGIVENARHGLAHIEAIEGEQILTREPELLKYAKSLMAKIPFRQIDVLIVQEIGKEISGAGMDPNVTGRSCVLGRSAPDVEKIAVLDLTEKSQGNAAGMGNADAITRKMFDKIDLMPIYVNGITCRDTEGIRIPAVMPDEELAIRFCLYTCVRHDALRNGRIVWIKNTGDLHRFWISESLVEEAKAINDVAILHNTKGAWNQCAF